MRKFNDVNINHVDKVKKLSKDEKLALKKEKKERKEELKALKKENKKVLITTKDFTEILDITENDVFKTRNGYLDILQITAKDIYSFSDYETNLNIYNFISFLKGYVDDVKLVSMKFPVSTLSQQNNIKKKLEVIQNPIYIKFLNEKLEELIFLEGHRSNREFFILVFGKDEDTLHNSLFRNENISIRFKKLSLEKKLKILFKLNNMNTKLG